MFLFAKRGNDRTAEQHWLLDQPEQVTSDASSCVLVISCFVKSTFTDVVDSSCHRIPTNILRGMRSVQIWVQGVVGVAAYVQLVSTVF